MSIGGKMEKKDNTTVYNRAKTSQIGLFVLNNTATNLYLFAFNFVVFYANGIAGLAVVLVSTIATAMRIFDGFTDPVIGFFIDKTETKFGKFRPFMLIGNITLALTLTIILKTTHLVPESIRVFYYIAIYALYIIGYTFQTACTKAGQTVLTNDPKQRPMFTLFDAIYNTLIFTGGQFLISNYMVPKHGGFTMSFFNELLIVILVVSAIFTLLSIFSLRDKDVKANWGAGTVTKTKFRDFWPIIKGNKPLQMLIIAASTDKLGNQVMRNSVVIVMLYGILMGNYELSGTLGLITLVPTLIITFLGVNYAKKFGIKKAYVGASYISIALYGALGAFLLLADLTTISLNPISLNTVIFLVLFILGQGAIAIGGNIVIPMIADTSDYETYNTGRYVPGMMGTIFSFVDKLISSLATTLVGLAVAVIGFREVFPTVDDVVTPGIKYMTVVLFVGVPILAWVASIIAMKFYTLDGDKMAEIQQELSNRKQAEIN